MTRTLLLADDSVTIQRVVELTFSGEDVRVVSVGDGEEAIARIPAVAPDIVLADIAMPKRSGYDVAAFVKGRADLSHIPVLLLAGAFEPVDEARAQQVSCDGVLVKPFEPQQVISRVRQLIDRAARPTGSPADVRAVRASPTAPAEDRQAVPGASDDYFDRLEAAFNRRGSSPEPTAADVAAVRTVSPTPDVLTLDQLLGEPRGSQEPIGAAPGDASAGSAPPGGHNRVGEAVAALFASEQPVTSSRPAGSGSLVGHAAPEELVDEVTRRVLERLKSSAPDGLVARIVAEVAERLVREEMNRLASSASEGR